MEKRPQNSKGSQLRKIGKKINSTRNSRGLEQKNNRTCITKTRDEEDKVERNPPLFHLEDMNGEEKLLMPIGDTYGGFPCQRR